MKSNMPKKDNMLRKSLLIAVIVLIIALIPIIISVMKVHAYKAFVDDYTESLNHARSNGGVVLVQDGETMAFSNDGASKIYTDIVGAGMGKEQKEFPEGDWPIYTLEFPDGAVLRLCQTEIKEQTAKNEIGVFISFTNKDGEVYQYDTDNLDGRIFVRNNLG